MGRYSRRGFLGALTKGVAALAAVATVDPERLLWVPGQKTYVLPPPAGWTTYRGFDLAVGKDWSVLVKAGPSLYEVQMHDPVPFKLVNAWVERADEAIYMHPEFAKTLRGMQDQMNLAANQHQDTLFNVPVFIEPSMPKDAILTRRRYSRDEWERVKGRYT